MDKKSKTGEFAQDLAAKIVMRRNKQGRYYDEDEMIEDRRFLERDIYEEMEEDRHERNYGY